jgi:hypothetical protein
MMNVFTAPDGTTGAVWITGLVTNGAAYALEALRPPR